MTTERAVVVRQTIIAPDAEAEKEWDRKYDRLAVAVDAAGVRIENRQGDLISHEHFDAIVIAVMGARDVLAWAKQQGESA